MSSKLILMRHGRSAWNRQNLFTGWVDIPLDEEGIREALEGGKKMRDMPIDVVFTSTLVRAHMTVVLSLLNHASHKTPVFLHEGQGKLDSWGHIYSESARQATIPVHSSSALNERMYGKLQGMNKAEMAEQFGAEQIKIWRRSYEGTPPSGESLAMTAARTIPYFQETVEPHLQRGQHVLVSAHGNSLRSIVMHLEQMGPEEIVKFEIPTGGILVYEYAHGNWTKQ